MSQHLTEFIRIPLESYQNIQKPTTYHPQTYQKPPQTPTKNRSETNQTPHGKKLWANLQRTLLPFFLLLFPQNLERWLQNQLEANLGILTCETPSNQPNHPSAPLRSTQELLYKATTSQIKPLAKHNDSSPHKKSSKNQIKTLQTNETSKDMQKKPTKIPSAEATLLLL